MAKLLRFVLNSIFPREYTSLIELIYFCKKSIIHVYFWKFLKTSELASYIGRCRKLCSTSCSAADMSQLEYRI